MEPHDAGSVATDGSPLKQYEQRKFAIAEIIRLAQAVNTTDGTLLSEVRELQARLAEDRFNLLVVGRFSRGKSTLMNAVLGSNLLPTGIVPLTSVITTVRYGSRKQVVLHFADSRMSREVPLARLAEYVTQQQNPGNVKKVEYAELQFPVEILRRGLFFVDSPGLGSAIAENSRTTERFVPQADAFILVTSYESPLSEEEDRMLRRIRNTGKKLFVILNKQDMVDDADKAQAIQFVSERLEQFSFAETPQVFSMSARQWLERGRKGDSSQSDSSGVQDFKNTLMRFLVEERAQSFLVNMYERTTRFLLDQAHLPEHAEHEAQFLALANRLRDLHEVILGGIHTQAASTSNGSDTRTGYSLDIDKKTGCHICGVILDGIFQFLSKYQYEITVNPETQQDHARRGGFCPLHTWQYEGISSPQGVCESYPKLVYRLAAELRNCADHNASNVIRSLLPTAKTCPVCQTRAKVERRAVEEAATTLRSATDRNFHAHACCLPHLTLLVDYLGPGEPAQRLILSHAALLERTAEDLQRYALKHDALRRHLTSEEERRASQLTLLLLAGHRNVSSPWAIESII